MTLREYSLLSPDGVARLLIINMRNVSYVRGVTKDEEQRGAGCVLTLDGQEMLLREPYVDVREDFKQAAVDAALPNMVC